MAKALGGVGRGRFAMRHIGCSFWHDVHDDPVGSDTFTVPADVGSPAGLAEG